MELEEKLKAAAELLHCQVDEFLAHGERANGDLVVIAKTGQKFVYSTDVLKYAMEKAAGKARKKAEPITGHKLPDVAEETFLGLPGESMPERGGNKAKQTTTTKRARSRSKKQ